MDSQRLLTPEELADVLRVRPSTVKTWARERRIPSVRASQVAIRFNLQDVLDALACDVREEAPDAAS
jgi:excisionase family DNA binding protein